jgi:hypothetical protein
LSSDSTRPTGGVFIARGTQVRISGLSVRLDGGPPSATLKLELNMPAYWFEISLGHLANAKSSRSELRTAVSAGSDEDISAALEGEFISSMQAIVSATTAIDALYAAVKTRIPIPPTFSAKRKTARWKQVSEVLRRGFNLAPASTNKVRAVMKELYRFRDWAVHPPAEFTDPAQHPVLKSFTEWRFSAFHYDHALLLVQAALAYAHQLARKPPINEDMRVFCEGLERLIAPSVAEWRSSFGPLLEDDPQPPADESAEEPKPSV